MFILNLLVQHLGRPGSNVEEGSLAAATAACPVEPPANLL